MLANPLLAAKAAPRGGKTRRGNETVQGTVPFSLFLGITPLGTVTPPHTHEAGLEEVQPRFLIALLASEMLICSVVLKRSRVKSLGKWERPDPPAFPSANEVDRLIDRLYVSSQYQLKSELTGGLQTHLRH